MALKYWIFMLRLAIPEVYGKVQYISSLSDLEEKLGRNAVQIPQHVIDYDRLQK